MAKNEDNVVFGIQPPPSPVIGLPVELLTALLERLNQPATGGMSVDQLAEILKATGLSTASAMQKALKPENQFHPGVSAYSYPEGDRDKPRQELRCPMTWAGHPVDSGNEGNEHWYELELLNQIEPGVFIVHKTDMSTMEVTVTATRGPGGTLEKMDCAFPVSGQDRFNHPPKPVVLLEMLGLDYMEAMTQYLKTMLDDQKAKSRPAVAA